jgi:hypothetical protein
MAILITTLPGTAIFRIADTRFPDLLPQVPAGSPFFSADRSGVHMGAIFVGLLPASLTLLTRQSARRAQ